MSSNSNGTDSKPRWLPAAGCGLILLLLVIGLSLWLAFRTATKVSSPDEPKEKPKAFVPPTPEQMRNQPAAETIAQMLRQRPDMSDPAVEAEIVRLMKESYDIRKKAAWEKAQQMGIPTEGTKPGGGTFELEDFKGDRPIYIVADNRNASISAATDTLRKPSEELPVDGTGMLIGVWELKTLRASHREFKKADGNSRVLVKDDAVGAPNDHATHVTGTIGAAGIKPEAQGMAPGATVHFFNASRDDGEMTEEGASGPEQSDKLLVGNASYGRGSLGWDFEGTRYVWYGEFSDDGRPTNDVDLSLGNYEAESEILDGVAQSRPWFLLVQSAGNHRNLGPPTPGERWRCDKDSQFRSYDPARHPAGNGLPGYMTVGGDKTCKNMLLVGSVTTAVQGNERKISQAQMTDGSCWGPASDGRIKPDVVAQGTDVYSSEGTADDAYGKRTGTSMASPVVAGSALLLQQLYKSKVDGMAMRAATLKALIIHTSDDLGNPGPDYQHGWGLINTKAAADVISAHAEGQNGGAILEDKVAKAGATKIFSFSWDGSRPLRVTLSWSDPAHDSSLSQQSPRHLVNDLDLSILGPDGATVHRPYVMPFQETGASQGSYLALAIQGVNRKDNVEQVYVAAPLPRGEYKIRIAPTDIREGNDQHFSLIISGNEAPPPKPGGGPLVHICQVGYLEKYFPTRRSHFLQLAEPGDLRQLPEFKDKPEEFSKVFGLAFYRRFNAPQPDQHLRFRPGSAGSGMAPSSEADVIYSSPTTSRDAIQRVGLMYWVMPQAYMPPTMDGTDFGGLRPMDPSDLLAPRFYAYSIIYYHGPPGQQFKATPDQLREGPLSPWTRCEVVPLLSHFHDSRDEPILDPKKRVPVARPNNHEGFIPVKVGAFVRMNGRIQMPKYFLDWRVMLPDFQPRYIYRYEALGQERFAIAEGHDSDSFVMGDGFFERSRLQPGNYPARVSFHLGNRNVQAQFEVNCTAQEDWDGAQKKLKEARAYLDERIATYTERARQHPNDPLVWDDLHLAGAYMSMSEAHLFCADFTNAEKYAKHAVEYWQRSVKLRPEHAAEAKFYRHLANVYYAWDKPVEYLKACEAMVEPTQLYMKKHPANDALSMHWELVSREYFNMTGDVEAARRYVQKMVETSIQTPPPQIRVEWWEDPRTYRSHPGSDPTRVTPRVLDPDPLTQRLPLK